MQYNLPVFNSTNTKIDLELIFFERAVAIIKIKNTDKYVVYDRQDNLWRLPGGHIEKNETAIQTAIRETNEEIGLKDLVFLKELGSSRLFFDYKDKISSVVEHYFLFQIDLINWQNKDKDEEGIYSILKTEKEIKKNNWDQYYWLFGKINS